MTHTDDVTEDEDSVATRGFTGEHDTGTENTPTARGRTLVATTPAQLLRGVEVGVGGRATAHCGATVGEAAHVAVRAHRMSDEAEWTAAALVCRSHLGERAAIDHPTAGVEEVVVGGYLDLRGDARERRHVLVFTPSEGEEGVFDYSPAGEGDGGE